MLFIVILYLFRCRRLYTIASHVDCIDSYATTTFENVFEEYNLYLISKTANPPEAHSEVIILHTTYYNEPQRGFHIHWRSSSMPQQCATFQHYFLDISLSKFVKMNKCFKMLLVAVRSINRETIPLFCHNRVVF